MSNQESNHYVDQGCSISKVGDRFNFSAHRGDAGLSGDAPNFKVAAQHIYEWQQELDKKAQAPEATPGN